MLLLSLTAACGALDPSPPPTPPGGGHPTVLSTAPANGASNVTLGGSVSATFSEAMDPSTLGAATFTLTSGATAIPVPGRLAYSGSTLVFWPSAPLASDVAYTATITSAATSLSGVALVTDVVWRFDTRPAVPGLGVNLGLAGNYAVLAQSGISAVPSSSIRGDLGISPAAATSVTGFSLSADPSNVFSTSSQVAGKVYAADFAVPTPSTLATAVVDMQLAYADAAGRTAGFTDLGNGRVDRLTLTPGVYRWNGDLLITSVVTLSGSASDVWVFQVGGSLGMGNGALVLLTGGARPGNVFWQVAGLVDLGMRVTAEGILMSRSSITLATGALVNGRLLAQTAVTIDQGTIVEPTPGGAGALP